MKSVAIRGELSELCTDDLYAPDPNQHLMAKMSMPVRTQAHLEMALPCV